MAAAALSSSLRGRELQQQQQHYGGGVGGANSGGGASSMNPQLLVEQKVRNVSSFLASLFSSFRLFLNVFPVRLLASYNINVVIIVAC
jgi:hypothetical protein